MGLFMNELESIRQIRKLLGCSMSGHCTFCPLEESEPTVPVGLMEAIQTQEFLYRNARLALEARDFQGVFGFLARASYIHEQLVLASPQTKTPTLLDNSDLKGDRSS